MIGAENIDYKNTINLLSQGHIRLCVEHNIQARNITNRIAEEPKQTRMELEQKIDLLELQLRQQILVSDLTNQLRIQQLQELIRSGHKSNEAMHTCHSEIYCCRREPCNQFSPTIHLLIFFGLHMNVRPQLFLF